MSERLIATDISVTFGGFQALTDVHLTARSGEVHAIIGPNGAGKTTLINVVSGVVSADSGSVMLDGVELIGLGQPAIARSGLSRSFQHPEVFQSLTPRQHRTACRPKAKADPALAAVVAEILERLPDVPAGELDFFDRRLVELARALAMHPRVLLLDEPVSGLDDAERQEMSRLVARLTEQGLCVVLIEHDMRVIRSLADTVTVLDEGRVVATASPDDLARDPKVVRAYLGG